MTSASVSSTHQFDLPLGVERYAANERADLVAFRRTLHGVASTATDPDQIRWLYEEDPNVRKGQPPLWLYKHHGKIVAHQGVRPITLKVGASEQEAAWVSSPIVHPEHRLQNIGQALQAQCNAERSVMLGFATHRDTKQALLQDGWIDLGNAPTFVRILDAGRAVAHHHDKPMLRGLGALANAPLAAVDGFIQARIAHKNIRMHEVDRFDGRVDKLWEQASGHYPVIAKRDRKNLNWRFADYPERCRYRCFYFFHDEQLVGYSVLRMDRSPLRAVGTLVDFLAAPEWLWFVLGRSLTVFRNAGMVQVNVVHTSHQGQKALRELGFIKRGSGLPLLYRASLLLAKDAAVLAQPQQWFVTGHDGEIDVAPGAAHRPSEARPLATKRPMRVTRASASAEDNQPSHVVS